MEVGTPRVRRRTLSRNDQVAVSWLLTDGQMSVFRAWFDREDGAAGGAGWFNILLALGDQGLRTREARFVGAYQAEAVSGLLWQVTGRLETRGNTLTGDQSLATVLGLVPSSGTYPSLTLDFTTGALDSRVSFTRTSSATYFNASGVMATAASGAPRFDHDPITLEPLGLQVEGSSTNLLRYSEDFSNAVWSATGVAVTIDAQAAPTGAVAMDKIVNSAATAQHRLALDGQVTLTAGTYTLSVFAKKAELNYLGLSLYTGTFHKATFNLTTGASTFVSNCTASAKDIGSGVWRVSITATISGDVMDANMASGFWPHASDVDTSQSELGDGVSGVYAWGAQLESGPLATSYIPTTTAAAVRSAETVQVALSPWYSSAIGAFYAEFVPNRTNTLTYQSAPGVLGQWLRAGGTSFNNFVAYDGANIAYASGVPAQFVTNKCAMSYSGTTQSVCLNGSTVGSAAYDGAYPDAVLQIGFANGHLYGHVKRAAYYPARLSDAELVELTR